ncbi:MAG: hypothetical protein WCG20_00845 [bacterium]
MKPFDPELQKLLVTPITQSRISPSREVVGFSFNIKLRKSKIGCIYSEESLEDESDMEDFMAWEKILAKKLFDINGVVGLTFEPYEISVQLHSSFNPEKIEIEAKRVIESYFVNIEKTKKPNFVPFSPN